MSSQVTRAAGAWAPLLHQGGADPRRATVIASIHAIAAALEHPDHEVDEERLEFQRFDLTDGSAGTSLLFAHLARASARSAELGDPELGDPEHWAELACAHLDHALEGVSSCPMSPALSGGFTGIAWSLGHLQRVLELEAEVPESIDDALSSLVARTPWSGELDLISGLVGFGAYFVSRLPDPAAKRGLLEILARLAETAHRDEHGLAWHTPPSKLPPELRAQYPHGYYDLGVAHGLAGVIGLLADIHAAGIAESLSRELLDASVSWLLAHELGGDAGHGFPWAHAPAMELEPARSAWCYGDPGIAVVLWRAATARQELAWARHAERLMHRACSHPRGIHDAGLCHGSAGLLQMLQRARQYAPDDSALKNAASTWLDWTLDARVEGSHGHVAGFRALTHERGQPVWIADRGLLGGAAGIGLVLLGLVSDDPPSWDRVLLLSGLESSHP